MRNPHQRYICYPSVVKVAQPTEVTVFPSDISRAFDLESEYKLGIFGLREDLLDYHKEPDYELPFRIENGCLKFSFTFAREQEYSIRIKIDGKTVKIPMYAVEADLFELRPLKGELHTHSYYSDGSDGVFMTPSDYREEGFDFFALTDHNRMFPSKAVRDFYKDVPLGISMLVGEEVHTPGSNLHIVHIGGSYSVCEKYIKHRDEFENEVAEIEKDLENVSEQYRYRLASAIWSCREIRKAGGISIFAHPFWKSNLYNVSAEFCDLLFDAKIFDVFELFNAAIVSRDNLQISLWLEQIQKGNTMPVVASSDSHCHDFAKDGFGRSFTIAFAKDNTEDSVKTAIKNGLCVACEIPLESDDEIRIYASEFRLVAFARFLWDNYFNNTWQMCIAEGNLMRRYAQGEDVKEVLAALSDSALNFYNKFFGKTKVDGLCKSRLDSLESLRTLQKESGLITSGSSLYIYGKNTVKY